MMGCSLPNRPAMPASPIPSWSVWRSDRASAAPRKVFEERATHAFPPVFRMPAEWRSEVESLAVQLGFPRTSAGEIEERFLAVLQRLTEVAD